MRKSDNDIKQLMAKAKIEAVTFFDRSAVVAVQLPDGTVMVETDVKNGEEFYEQQSAETCLRKIYDRVGKKLNEKPVKLTKQQAEVIVAIAENGGAKPAAEKLNYSRGGLQYHISKIRESTGKDPLEFFQMCELLVAAREELSQ